MICSKKVVNKKALKAYSTLEEDFNKVHNYFYDYSKFVYENKDSKSTIICPVHGEFLQNSNNHKRGAKCPKCSKVYKPTTAEWVAAAKEKFNNKYDYTSIVYLSATTPVTIVCPIHGQFTQIPRIHLTSVTGCPECGIVSMGLNHKSSTEDFILKSQKVHNYTYDYSDVIYINAISKVSIKCKTHGKFEQTCSDHLKGAGCPKCAITGFNIEKPAILYYLKVKHKGEYYYKIGVTNNTVERRYTAGDREKIVDYVYEEYYKGSDALYWEEHFKRKYHNSLYTKGDIVLKGAPGNTELFTSDVLNKFKD